MGSVVTLLPGQRKMPFVDESTHSLPATSKARNVDCKSHGVVGLDRVLPRAPRSKDMLPKETTAFLPWSSRPTESQTVVKGAGTLRRLANCAANRDEILVNRSITESATVASL